MNKMNFKIRHGNGAPDEEKEGSLYELLCNIPYLLLDNYVIPLNVINSILLKGIEDSGMSGGCEWKPFQIDQKEYNELQEHLTNKNYIKTVVPEWVIDRRTWQIFIFEIKHGVPHKPHLEIDRKIQNIEEALSKAREIGDSEKEGTFMLELVEASEELNELYSKHLQS